MPQAHRPHRALRRPSFPRRLKTLALLSALLATAFVALDIHAQSSGALTFVERHTGSGLDGARQLAISPDGNHVYSVAISTASNGYVVVFSRDAGTGELTVVEIESGHPGLRGVQAVEVSPNGQFVYVCTLTDQSVLAFSRHTTTGELTYLSTVDVGSNMTDLLISPDGEHAYAASSGDIERFSLDPVTGAITFEDQFDIGGTSNQFAMSPDGTTIYHADISGNRVLVIDRDLATGVLTLADVVNDGDGGAKLGTVLGLEVSPGGAFLYTFARDQLVITTFNRDLTTGELTYANEVSAGSDIRDLGITSDGDFVVAADEGSNRLLSFSRDLSTGALTLVDTEIDGVGGVDGLDGARAVVISPDDAFVYTAARRDDAVDVFALDNAPPCAGAAPGWDGQVATGGDTNRYLHLTAACGFDTVEFWNTANLTLGGAFLSGDGGATFAPATDYAAYSTGSCTVAEPGLTDCMGYAFTGTSGDEADELWIRVAPIAPGQASTFFLAMTDAEAVTTNIDPVLTAEAVPTVPAALQIEGAYPNPFNPSTHVAFSVPEAQSVRLAVYDLLGRHVATLVDAHVDAGRLTARWDGLDAAGRAVPSGVYLVRLQGAGRAETLPLTLVK